MQQERNPTTLNQMMTQIRELQNKVNSLSDAREFENSLNQGAAPERLLFWVLEPCRAAILDCRVIHKIVWETLKNDHLLKKGYPLQSSTVQRIWHHPLRNWGFVLPELQERKRVKWKESRWIRRFLFTISNVEVACCIILVELILTVMMDYQRIPISKCILGNSWLCGISKLESQLQDWGFSENSRSSSHYALDRRSWDCKVNWRTCDITIYCGSNWFSWRRYAWCDDCVCIEKASQHADTLPKKSRCRRATC